MEAVGGRVAAIAVGDHGGVPDAAVVSASSLACTLVGALRRPPDGARTLATRGAARTSQLSGWASDRAYPETCVLAVLTVLTVVLVGAAAAAGGGVALR